MSELTDLFETLAKIPSPSMHEDTVAEKIVSLLNGYGVSARRDAFGNVRAEIPATDETKEPLLLSAHMDVVGDFSPVNVVKDGDVLKTDGKRTLGADDKAGVACAMMLAKTVANDKTLKHGGLEIVFTRDEEQNMSGARALDFGTFKSEYVLVLDGDRLGDFQIAGAGYTKMILSVTNTKGGHSGIDIADSRRVNAVKAIAEIMTEIPQGVFYADETGVVTSINAGAVVGGGVRNLPTEKQGADFALHLTDTAMSNIINTDAFALYSIRSSDKAKEAELIANIEKTVEKFNDKYGEKATVSVSFEQHIPPFEKSSDTTMIDTAKRAAEKIRLPLNVSSFHAGAETHLYAQKKNKAGVAFKPYLVGAANIHNMHSAAEYVETPSMDRGFDFVNALFGAFNAR